MPINISGNSNIQTLFSSVGNSKKDEKENSMNSLFSALGSGDANGVDLSTYNALKNGSYYKVMKKYYKNQSETQMPEEELKKAEKKIEATADAAGDVVGAFNEIKKLSFKEEDREKAAEKAADFIKKYNSLVSYGDDSLYNNVAQKTEWMMNLTDQNAALLNNAGITVGADGKLSFDKEAFMKADEDTLRDTFTRNASWAEKVEYKAEQIYSLALTGDTSANSYTNSATYGAGNASSYNASV
ncbi:MAG: hypothetical protein K6E77_03155 [Lachnospiraceae bacterium]|nr:hypothetical protein [Lachnospiraceae bacterium]